MEVFLYVVYDRQQGHPFFPRDETIICTLMVRPVLTTDVVLCYDAR